MTYQYYNVGGTQATGILKIEGEVTICIPSDPANRDWAEYQAWLAADPENNVPEPAE